jgi:hypothetical protein
MHPEETMQAADHKGKAFDSPVVIVAGVDLGRSAVFTCPCPNLTRKALAEWGCDSVMARSGDSPPWQYAVFVTMTRDRRSYSQTVTS